jgi:DNA adenine methylase
LNKHGFNGLCRYNKSGKFNVPIGTSTKPKNFPVQQILDFHDKFNNYGVQLSSSNFIEVFESVNQQDNVLIYCDPPYVPLTSDFNYTADGFGIDQQLQLRDLAKESKHTVIISNHWTPVTEQLYSDADEIVVFDVQRTISCKGSDRKKVQECIVVYGGN